MRTKSRTLLVTLKWMSCRTRGVYTMSGKIVLNAFYVSSCAWRVRLALAYKEIDYEYRAWNLATGEHLTEEYKKISPLSFVPALETDGITIVESVAIMEFLEERFPQTKPLLPKDLGRRAAIRSFVNIITSGIQPLQNLRVLIAVAELDGEEAKQDWAQKWIKTGFHALEQMAKKTAGKYSFGDEFTMADAALVPQLANADRFKVNMDEFPTLQRLQKSLFEVEFIGKSKPEFQPDYPSAK